jgi:hypothetical protein
LAHVLEFSEDLLDGLRYDAELALVLQEAKLAHGVLVTEVIVPMRPEHSVSLA